MILSPFSSTKSRAKPLCHHIHQFFIIARNIQSFCKLLADISSAASVLPADCYNSLLHMNSSSDSRYTLFYPIFMDLSPFLSKSKDSWLLIAFGLSFNPARVDVPGSILSPFCRESMSGFQSSAPTKLPPPSFVLRFFQSASSDTVRRQKPHEKYLRPR